MPHAYGTTRIHVVHDVPAWLSAQERIVLHALVVGLQPTRVLEIGTFQGGSTVIMCAALDDLGGGTITCVDPNPRVADETWSRVSHRATMVPEPSPEAVATAKDVAGGQFEFAFIDGDHSLDAVMRDIEATLPVLTDDAHMLFHDAHWWEVEQGIDAILARYPDQLADAGMVSAGDSIIVEDGQTQRWGGMRLVRFRRSGT